MRRSLRHAAALATLVASLACSAAGHAASPFEKNFWLEGPRYHGVLPVCDHPAALSKVMQRFAQKEGGFWNSTLQIVEFERVREVAFRPWAEQAIPRRFCSGIAVISDGKRRRVNFSIIEDAGLIGFNWGVEWCVVGLDRNWAYNPACRMALP